MGWKILFLYCPNIALTAQSLVSYINSNSELQSGVMMIGAKINHFLKSLKVVKQSSSKLNIESFSNNLQNGLEIFEKSLMNLL